MDAANSRLLRAKRLIDSTGGPVQQDWAILVREGVIDQVGPGDEIETPPGTEEIDLGDRTLMPGMVDAHMHFFGINSTKFETLATEDERYRVLRAAGEARLMLEAGITSCKCLGSSVTPSLRRAVNEGHVPGPRIQTAGEFICSTNGTWDHVSLPLAVAKSTGMIADGIEGMREAVRLRIRQGSTVIKVGLSMGDIDDEYHPWGDDPDRQLAGYSLEEVRALTDEAHLNNLKVSAHAIGDDAVVRALDGDVDVIEHAYGITEPIRRRLVEEEALVVTTFSQLWAHNEAARPHHYPDSLREVFLRHTAAQKRDFQLSLEAGVRYALGTDLIGYPTHPQDKGAKEFEIAVEYGMSPMEAIVAGTATSAEALGMADAIGTLEKGKVADIIALPGDPVEDITALARVDFVMQDGNVVVGEDVPVVAPV